MIKSEHQSAIIDKHGGSEPLHARDISGRAGVLAPHDQFYVRVMRLSDSGFVDSAIDLVNEHFDEILRTGRLGACDSLLLDTPVHDLHTDVLLAVLVATLPEKQRLTTRPGFVLKVEEEIKRRGEWEEGILDGLWSE